MTTLKNDGITPTRDRALTPAAIEWRNDCPFATQFNDIYFSSVPSQMLDEIDHVFLRPNNIAARLASAQQQTLIDTGSVDDTAVDIGNSASTGANIVTIGELGFGTGLNFFCTAKLFLSLQTEQLIDKTESTVSAKNTTLHFISFEKHPLHKDHFQRFIEALLNHLDAPVELSALASALLAQYPIAVEGIHRLSFPSLKIQLTLVYGDANEQLKQFNPNITQIDTWYLDGFAPAKNPAMWQPELFEQIAKLSSRGTSYSTFTAAGNVRKALADAGFTVKKIPGFGRKREMITGELDSPPEIMSSDRPHTDYLPCEKPWFKPNKPFKQFPLSSTTNGDAVVIGGGLAGTAVAHALATRGAKVILIERNAALAQGASGNPMGALFTKFSPYDTPQNRFYQYAYFDAIRHLTMFQHELNGHNGDYWDLCGALQLAYDEKEAQRQRKLIDAKCWPKSVVQPVSREEVEALCGFPSPHAGLFLPDGGWVHPPSLCNLRVKHPNITVITHNEAISLEQTNTTTSTTAQRLWRAVGSNQQSIATAPLLIICNAQDAKQFQQTSYLPLTIIRGQITYLAQTTASRKLQRVVCYNGYTGPATRGFHTIGATFQPKSTMMQLRPEDHRANIKHLIEGLPTFAEAVNVGSINNDDDIHQHDDLHKNSEAGRVALRTQTPDYLPLVGPVPNITAFQKAYRPIISGNKHIRLPCGDYLKGLFISCGHGSRGLTTSSLCANILAGYISGEPAPIDHQVLEAIHPARFIIRSLKTPPK